MSDSKIVIDVVKDFLYSIRFQAQLFELHLQCFDCRIMARGTPEETRKVHSIATSLDTNTALIRLEGGQKLLEQALWNLISNIP